MRQDGGTLEVAMLEEGVFFGEAEWSLDALGGISSHCRRV